MWRHIASNALTLFIVLLFLAAGAISWGSSSYRSAGPLADPICLRVPSGGTMRGVSEDLAESGAISSAALFRVGADYAGVAGDLKAGSFLIPEGASMEDIVATVTGDGQSTCGTEIVYRVGVTRVLAEVRELDPATGRYEELAEFETTAEAEVPEAYARKKQEADTQFRMVVAEGVTSWQVMTALNSVDILAGEITEVPDEGRLAPGDYPLANGLAVAEVLAEMQARQDRTLAEAWAARDEGLPLASPEEALILASIIEMETGVPEERGQVASVFVNRLNRGMPLQTDPTVIYGITRGQGTLGRGLLQSELRAETPWNTYVIPALPPTPIANPGVASIEAALNPDSTEFIFFVADGTGGHAFATNLDDHNENVRRWREIEAERAAESEEG